MSFTFLYAAFTLLALLIIFGVSLKIKGLKFAFITTGIAFVFSALLLIVTIYAIVSVMPN